PRPWTSRTEREVSQRVVAAVPPPGQVSTFPALRLHLRAFQLRGDLPPADPVLGGVLRVPGWRANPSRIEKSGCAAQEFKEGGDLAPRLLFFGPRTAHGNLPRCAGMRTVERAVPTYPPRRA